MTGAEVAILGESFLALTRSVASAVVQQARDAGALGAGETFRDLSVPGAELSDDSLARQYQRAAAAGPVKVALVLAGASDVGLGGRCVPGDDASCSDVRSAALHLLEQMAQGGVEDLLLSFYPEPWGLGAHLKAPLDALRPQLQQLCANAPAPMRCHFLDLRPIWDGHPEYSVDGLYPSHTGSRATGEAMWQALVQTCVMPG